MSTIDFRFAEENVICKTEEDIGEEQTWELCDSIQSYMDGVIGDDDYNPVEVVETIMSESELKYEIVVPDYYVFVE